MSILGVSAPTDTVMDAMKHGDKIMWKLLI